MIIVWEEDGSNFLIVALIIKKVVTRDSIILSKSATLEYCNCQQVIRSTSCLVLG